MLKKCMFIGLLQYGVICNAFESPEHLIAGSIVKLKYPNKVVETGDKSYVLNVNDAGGQDLRLSFADLIYLVDYMGDPKIQIGQHDELINEAAFIKNFATINQIPNKNYLPSVMNLVNKQTDMNISNITNHQRIFIPSDANRNFNCVTGGGCSPWNWLIKPGLYLKLADYNYDHFGKDAINAYLAGHSVALKTALLARQTVNPALLRDAYAYEGYAQHFLTDLAASGHILTPRKEIAKWCSYTPATISLYLANRMHDEDNANGLYVTDNSGESWFAYGDSEMFLKGNESALNKLVRNMQKSVNQVYDVYSGSLTVEKAYIDSHLWLPNIEATRNDPRNPPVLFKMQNGNLMEYDKKNKLYREVYNCTVSALKYL